MVTLFARGGVVLTTAIASLALLTSTAGAQPALDPAFGGGLVTPKVFATGKYPQVAQGAVVQTDGKVLAAMSLSTKYGQRFHRPVLRFGTDGTIDRTYGKNGVAWVPRPGGEKYFGFSGISLQSDGRALAFGQTQRSAKSAPGTFVSRLTTTGKLDRSFGDQGVVTFAGGSGEKSLSFILSATQLENGRVLLVFRRDANDGRSLKLIQLNRDGSPDSSFGKNGIRRIVLARHQFFVQVTDSQVHGNVIDVLAFFDRETKGPACRVYRFNLANKGALVKSFGGRGSVGLPVLGDDQDMTCSSLTTTLDGGVAAAGSYLDLASDTNEQPGFVYKLLANGRPDPAFGVSGLVTTSEAIRPTTVAGLADGSYLLAGEHPNQKSSQDPDYGTVTQIDATGKVVPSFGLAGFLKLTPHAYAGAINHTTGGNAIVYSTYRKSDFGTSQIAKLTN
jgi:uncharacterized delta-60 repeat protein